MDKKQRWIMFIAIDVVVLILLGFLAYNFYFKEKVDNPNDPLSDFSIFENLGNNGEEIENLVREKLRTEKQDWFSWWNKVTPYLAFDKFNLETVNKLPPGQKTSYVGNVSDDAIRKEKNVYAKSPNQKMLADPLVGVFLTKENNKVRGGFDVDSSLAIIDLEKDTYEQVLTCGTPCGFDDAVWLDNNKVLVFGYQILFRATNNPDLDSDYAPALWVVDLENRAVHQYVGPRISKAEYLKNNRTIYLTKRYGGITFE